MSNNSLKIHCKKCLTIQKATVKGTTIYTNCVDSNVECLTCGTNHTVSYAVSMSAILPDAKQERLLLDDENIEKPKGAFHWELDMNYHPHETT